MVVLLEEEGDPGEHAVDPGAQGSSDGFVLSNGQDDVPTLNGLPSTALTTTLRSPRERSVLGRFLPLFHHGICCLACGVGSRQEMVFSLVRRRAMRSAIAIWTMASERAGRVS